MDIIIIITLHYIAQRFPLSDTYKTLEYGYRSRYNLQKHRQKTEANSRLKHARMKQILWKCGFNLICMFYNFCIFYLPCSATIFLTRYSCQRDSLWGYFLVKVKRNFKVIWHCPGNEYFWPLKRRLFHLWWENWNSQKNPKMNRFQTTTPLPRDTVIGAIFKLRLQI